MIEPVKKVILTESLFRRKNLKNKISQESTVGRVLWEGTVGKNVGRTVGPVYFTKKFRDRKSVV